MAREFSVVIGINAAKAKAGARQFKAGAEQVNRANRGMQRSTARTTKRMTAMITTLGRMRGVMTVAFAGFLGVGGISAVVRTLATFETSISSVASLISAQNPRSLTANVNVLTARARELGATTLFTASQAAEGMKFLTLAGFSTVDVYQAIEPALNLAAAGMLGLGQAADIVSNIMAAFNVDASETESVVDVLAFTSARTNTNIQQLGQAMKFVGPVAGTLGINVQETAVALGILGNSGLQASLAGTSLRRVMSGLLNPSKEADKVLAKMGLTSTELVDILQGGGETGKGLVDLVNKLAASGLGAAEAFTLFGQRGAPGMLSLLTQAEKLAELTDELDNIAGTAKRMAKILADNIGGDARIAISSLQESILQLGDAGLTDWLRESIQGFTGFIRVFTGTVTPAEEFSEAMEKGAKRAEFLQRHLGMLKSAIIGLALVMLRNLIPNLLRSITLMGVWATTTLPTVIKGLFTATSATRAFGLSLFFVKGALLATGIGAAVVVLGAFVNLAMGMVDAEEASVSFADSLEDIKVRGEEVATVFQLMGQRQQENALRDSASDILKTKNKMNDLTEAVMAQDVARLTLTDDTQAYHDALEKSAGIDTGPSGFSNIMANSKATGDLITAKLELTATEKAEQLDREKSLLQLEILEQSLNKQEQLRLDLIAVQNGEADSVAALRAEREKNLELKKKELVTFEKTFGIQKDEEKLIKDLIKTLLKRQTAMQKVTAQQELMTAAANGNVKALDTLGIASKDVAAAQEVLAFMMKKAERTMNVLEKAQDSETRSLEDLRAKMFDLRNETGGTAKLTLEFERAVILADLALEDHSLTVLQHREKVRLLKEEYALATDGICEGNKKARECTEDSAKKMEAIWDRAMGNIQDSFADAFRGAFDSASSFFDKIVDAFKDMISQMLGAWAASGLFNLFAGESFSANGNTFGSFFQAGASALTKRIGTSGTNTTGTGTSGTNTTGTTGTGVVTQLFGEGTPMGDAMASLSAGVTAFYQGFTATFGVGSGGAAASTLGISGTGLGGYGTSTQAIAQAGGSNAAVVGSSFANAGVGIIAGAIADAILGGRGDATRNMIFSAIGGVIGGYFAGPWGAAIGGAIGSFVDNLLGGAKKLEKSTLSLKIAGSNFAGVQEDIVSKQRSFFRGKKRTTFTTDVSGELSGLEDVFVGFVDLVVGQAEKFGGATDFLDSFSFTYTDFNLKKKSSAEVGAFLEKFLNDAMLAAIDDFLEDVEGLPARMKVTLDTFSRNVEDFLIAFELLGAIENLFDIDLVQASADAIVESQAGILQGYQLALVGYREVIAEYDGSLDSLKALTEATAVFTQIQLELVMVYQQLGQELSAMFQSSAQTVREALMSEEELYNLRRDQIDDLVAQAAETTDPAELARLATEIDRLGLDAFNMLDADQQSLLGPEFIEFFEGLDEYFGGQIDEGINDVITTQAALDLEVSNRLLEAANALLEAATVIVSPTYPFDEDGNYIGGNPNLQDDPDDYDYRGESEIALS